MKNGLFIGMPILCTVMTAQGGLGFFESFETYEVNEFGLATYFDGESFGSWDVTSGSVDLVDASMYPTLVGSQHGDRSLDLLGSPGVGSIERSFETFEGVQYDYSFWYSRNTGAGVLAEADMQILDGSSEARTLIKAETGFSSTTVDPSAFVQVSGSFVAMSDTTIIRFGGQEIELGNQSYGIILDSVSVSIGSEVPSPGALAVLGLGGLVGGRRRR